MTWITAGYAWRCRAPAVIRWLTMTSGLCSLSILAMTTQAAPLMLKAGASPDDPALLSSLLEPFVAWSYARFACAGVSFVLMLVALTIVATGEREAPSGR